MIYHIAAYACVAMLYSEFLWVAEDKLLDGDKLSTLVKTMIGHSIQPLRQLRVEIERVYLGSEVQAYEDAEDEEDILNKFRSHTLLTARSKYGVEHGTLPCLSSDLLSRYRDGSILRQRLYGLIPGAAEVLPLKVRSQTGTHGVGNQSGSTNLGADVVDQLKETVSELAKTVRELQLQLNKAQGVPRLPSVPLDPDADMPMDLDFPRLPSPAPLIAHVAMDPDANMPMGLDVPHLPSPAPLPAREALERSNTVSDSVPVDALGLLREMLGNPNAQWKSAEQAEAVRVALARQDDFIAILNLGEGKSLVYQLPAFHDDGLWTLVVCPNKSLLNDQLNSCRKLGLNAVQWYAKAHENALPPHTNVVFVALETAASPTFSSFVTRNLPTVSRIFYDEAHEILLDIGWRKQWGDLQYLRELPVQQGWASATLPLRTMQHFRQAFALSRNVVTVRSDFVQPRMRFMVLDLDGKTDIRRFLNDLQPLLEEKYMGADGQGIIFRAYVNEILDHWRPGEPTSVSFAGWKDRLEHETYWLEHDTDFIMATTTCIHGINNLRCNVVIFVHFFPSLLLAAQGSGRGGRDGQECLVIFIKHGCLTWIPHPSQDSDRDCHGEGLEFLANKPGQCRRHIFGMTFNGKPQTCGSINGTLCDRCDPNFPLYADIQAIIPEQPPTDSESEDEFNDFFSDSAFQNPELTREPIIDPPAPSSDDFDAFFTDSLFHDPDLTHEPEAVAAGPVAATSVATAPQFVAPKRGPVQPSKNVQRNAAEYRQAVALKKANSGVLGKLSSNLAGKCAACWAYTGAFVVSGSNHRTFRTCSMGNHASSAHFNHRYQQWENLISHVPYTACFRCGFPQDKEFLLYGHPLPGKSATCPNISAMKHILWVVRNTKDFWNRAYKEFELPYDIGDGDFAKWAVDGKSTIRHHNGAEVILWLNGIHKSVT
ncbi:P-loop containing nucleoside triphosphate hydrolase protein [Mycena sanguinolenta]|nr:P-loop containing nucleoside triphosphate hydrolase protein [Mycena sanguinolenta]